MKFLKDNFKQGFNFHNYWVEKSIHIYINTNALKYTDAHKRTHIRMHAYTRTQTHTYSLALQHTHTHTHTHTHIHTQTHPQTYPFAHRLTKIYYN